MMRFSNLARNPARTGYRRRSDASAPATQADPRRQAAMGISVQPVHGHHCICERCQRSAPGR